MPDSRHLYDWQWTDLIERVLEMSQLLLDVARLHHQIHVLERSDQRHIDGDRRSQQRLKNNYNDLIQEIQVRVGGIHERFDLWRESVQTVAYKAATYHQHDELNDIIGPIVCRTQQYMKHMMDAYPEWRDCPDECSVCGSFGPGAN